MPVSGSQRSFRARTGRPRSCRVTVTLDRHPTTRAARRRALDRAEQEEHVQRLVEVRRHPELDGANFRSRRRRRRRCQAGDCFLTLVGDDRAFARPIDRALRDLDGEPIPRTLPAKPALSAAPVVIERPREVRDRRHPDPPRPGGLAIASAFVHGRPRGPRRRSARGIAWWAAGAMPSTARLRSTSTISLSSRQLRGTAVAGIDRLARLFRHSVRQHHRRT